MKRHEIIEQIVIPAAKAGVFCIEINPKNHCAKCSIVADCSNRFGGKGTSTDEYAEAKLATAEAWLAKWRVKHEGVDVTIPDTPVLTDEEIADATKCKTSNAECSSCALNKRLLDVNSVIELLARALQVERGKLCQISALYDAVFEHLSPGLSQASALLDYVEGVRRVLDGN